jgi:hypothetical protein
MPARVPGSRTASCDKDTRGGRFIPGWGQLLKIVKQDARGEQPVGTRHDPKPMMSEIDTDDGHMKKHTGDGKNGEKQRDRKNGIAWRRQPATTK